MTTDSTNDAKTQESEPKARLAEMPRDARKPEREQKEPFCLGKRTYPVWTKAMVEARERYRREGKRWYLLYDKLYDLRNLREAWKQVEANQGAAGLSGETVEQYRDGIDDRLAKLSKRLKEQNYEVRPIRRKHIPKADGSGKMRPLGIPEVEDRIVQTAIVRLIEPIFEDKFLERSYGFRPERSAHHALAQVEAALTNGKTIVVDADIRDCFGSIPFEPLMEEVAREIGDGKLLSLIRRFVEADIVEEMHRWHPESGTPQGAVLSPLLANIYLHGFDLAMERAGLETVRYADDFVVMCRTEDEGQRALEQVRWVLTAMGLSLHPEKTRIVDARRGGFQFLGYEFWPWGRKPRPSSRDKLHDRIRARTPRKGGQSLREVIRRLNPTLRGWYAYFRHCHPNVFDDVDGRIRRRLRSILRAFEKRKGSARRQDNIRYPNRLFDALHLFSLSREHAQEAGARRLIAFPAKA